MMPSIGLNKIKGYERKDTNRNDGIGDACAGQVRLKLSDNECEYLVKSDMIENFGFDPPMDSTKSLL